jgi:hypothetical protein
MVKTVPEETEVEIMFVIQITVLELALQTIPVLKVADLDTVAEQDPVEIERSDGRVIFTAEPEDNGLNIVKTKVYVVDADTRAEVGVIVEVEKTLGKTVIVLIEFA